MAMDEMQAVGANVPNPDLNGPAVADSIDFQAKYQEERNKRLKSEGSSQYIDLRLSEQHKRFIGTHSSRLATIQTDRCYLHLERGPLDTCIYAGQYSGARQGACEDFNHRRRLGWHLGRR